jgi:hypothetical protein
MRYSNLLNTHTLRWTGKLLPLPAFTAMSAIDPVERFDIPATTEQAGILKDFRQSLELDTRSDSARAFCTDGTLLRYLRARNWKIKDAKKMLDASLAWRDEMNPEQVRCPKCAKDPMAHNMRCVGLDSLGRPVIYTCFRQAHDRWNAEANMMHMIQTLEGASVLMEAEGIQVNPSGKWVWVIDFEGYSLSDNNPKTTMLAARLLDQYPERLGLCVLFGAPWLFSAVWKVVRPILNEVTANKVVFLEGGLAKQEKWRPVLASHFDEELLAWMLQEFEENRQAANDKKAYWEWCNSDGSHKPHDARGTASYVGSASYVAAVSSEFCESTDWEEARGDATHQEGDGGGSGGSGTATAGS